jgi:hypothetical protein
VVRVPGIALVMTEIEVMLEARFDFLCSGADAHGKQGEREAEI